MNSFKNAFERILLENINEPSQDRPRRPRYNPDEDREAFDDRPRRPRYNPDKDREAFDAGLDPDTDPSELDIEGLPEFESAVDQTTQQVIQWGEEMESFTKRLLDPENPEALLTKLTAVTSIPEYANAAEAVSKHLRKAIAEIASAKTELDVLASMAASRRDIRRKQDNSTAGPSGPY